MGSIQYSDSLNYPIKCPDGTHVYPSDNNKGKKACWRWSQKKLFWGIENGFIEFKKDKAGIWTVYTKQYLKCDNDGNIIQRTQRPDGVINDFLARRAQKLLFNFSTVLFSLIQRMLTLLNGLLTAFLRRNQTQFWIFLLALVQQDTLY